MTVFPDSPTSKQSRSGATDASACKPGTDLRALTQEGYELTMLVNCGFTAVATGQGGLPLILLRNDRGMRVVTRPPGRALINSRDTLRTAGRRRPMMASRGMRSVA
jgi:hypothetical protein